jgi:hypothetical protein
MLFLDGGLFTGTRARGLRDQGPILGEAVGEYGVGEAVAIEDAAAAHPRDLLIAVLKLNDAPGVQIEEDGARLHRSQARLSSQLVDDAKHGLLMGPAEFEGPVNGLVVAIGVALVEDGEAVQDVVAQGVVERFGVLEEVVQGPGVGDACLDEGGEDIGVCDETHPSLSVDDRTA